MLNACQTKQVKNPLRSSFRGGGETGASKVLPLVLPHLLILLVVQNTCHKYDNNIVHHLLPSSSCCLYTDLHSLQEPCTLLYIQESWTLCYMCCIFLEGSLPWRHHRYPWFQPVLQTRHLRLSLLLYRSEGRAIFSPQRVLWLIEKTTSHN